MKHLEQVLKFTKKLTRKGAVSLLAILLYANCAHAQDGAGKINLAKEVVGPKFLDHPTTVSGIPCTRYLWTWKKDGSIEQCQLAAAARSNGIDIPEGSTVFFYPGGKHTLHVWFSKPTTVQGIPCNGGRYSKIDTAFYESGKLKGIFISKPITLQGMPIKKSVFSPLYLYENGKVKECTLASETEVDGKKYPKDTTLKFDGTGKVIQNTPAPSKLEILGGIFRRNPKK